MRMPNLREMLADYVFQPKHSITLVKGQKGIYGWEIKVEGKNIDDLLKKLKQVDDHLRLNYGINLKENSDA